LRGQRCPKAHGQERHRSTEALQRRLHGLRVPKEDLRRDRGWIYEQTGIEVPADLQAFDIYRNPRETISCQGKISYRGPIQA